MTLHQITEDNLNNSFVNVKKEVTIKSFDCAGIKLKIEILSCIIEIEKEFNCVTLKNCDENHIGMSNSLKKLAEVESKHNKNELSTHCKLMSE